MCTATWWRAKDTYGVLFNRDESRRRLEALAPAQFDDYGYCYICPVDGDAGGTWIWVNSQGVIACLLNNYQHHTKAPEKAISRGLFLKSLVYNRDSEALCNRLDEMKLNCYQAFLLFVIDADTHHLLTWDGSVLSHRTGQTLSCPITSSGYLPEAVINYRVDLFRKEFGADPKPCYEQLTRFHNHVDPEHPAHSILMTRPEARTVSQSHVHVGPDHIVFSYWSILENAESSQATSRTLRREQ